MIALIQRVTQANVFVNNEIIGQIDQGLVALIGVEKADTEQQADRLLQRLLNYRIFSDSDDKMNLSVSDVNGGLLLVPQFTLAADTQKGMRPSFTPAAPPKQGKALFDYLVKQASHSGLPIQTGQFGADMQVALVNDGPVTFWLQATHKG
jgi:D-tyrosyl-tRNA(Tyr) deacylase